MTCPAPLAVFAGSDACAHSFVWSSAAARSLRRARQSPDIEKPLLNIDDDISAFAFAPDGRIFLSIPRATIFTPKQYDLERDDIWLQDTGGKRRACCRRKNSRAAIRRSATSSIPFAGRPMAG